MYRDTIADLGRMIDALTLRRDTLKRRLDWRADRSFAKGNALADYTTLPDDLPVPANDGAADQLPGRSTLALTLQTSDGDHVDLGDLGLGRTVVYPYPLTGHPGADLPEGWDAIPGARGGGAPPRRRSRVPLQNSSLIGGRLHQRGSVGGAHGSAF